MSITQMDKVGLHGLCRRGLTVLGQLVAHGVLKRTGQQEIGQEASHFLMILLLILEEDVLDHQDLLRTALGRRKLAHIFLGSWERWKRKHVPINWWSRTNPQLT